MRTLFAPVIGAMLAAGCALETQDVVYAGGLAPVSGTCDPRARATLTIRHDAVLFAPSSGVTTLAGRVEADGSVAAAAIKTGMDHQPYRLSLAAQRKGDAISGIYTTPRCRYHLDLVRSR